MFNHYLLVGRFRPSYLAGQALVPLVFLCAGWLIVHPTWWRGVLLGVALTLQLLTGNAQIVCYTGYSLLIAAPIYLLCRREWRSPYLARLVGAAAVAGVTFVLLSAVQLLPTLEVVGHATRGFGGLTFEQTRPWAVNLQRITLVTFSSGPVAVLAVFALTDRRRLRVVLPCAAVLLFTALVALWTPFYRDFFFLLPGIDLFRERQWILIIGAFALAILAGTGMDKVLCAPPGRERWRLAGVSVIILGGLAAAAHNPAIPTYFTGAVLAGTLLALLTDRQRARFLLLWLAVALVVAQRFRGPAYNEVMLPQHNVEAFFAAPPFVRFLREHVGADRVLAIKDWRDRFPIMEKMGTLYGFGVVQDYEPLAPRVYQEFLRPLEQRNMDAPLFWGRFFPRPTDPGWQLLDMMATKYVVVAPGARFGNLAPPFAKPLPPRFRLVYSGADARIYENMEALPRAYLVAEDHVVQLPDALAAVQAPGVDPRAMAVVDREIEWQSLAETASVTEAVRFIQHSAAEVVLQLNTPRRALLVLADLYWPGWKVSVDGVPRDLYRVNYLFRGVPVGSGLHTVRFWYDPSSLKVGASVTLSTIGLLSILAIVQLHRSRRRKWRTDPSV